MKTCQQQVDDCVQKNNAITNVYNKNKINNVQKELELNTLEARCKEEIESLQQSIQELFVAKTNRNESYYVFDSQKKHLYSN